MKLKKTIALVIALMVTTIPAISFASGGFVLFTELFVKRMVRFDRYFKLTPMSVVFADDGKTVVSTSAGMLCINESWDIEFITPSLDLTKSDDKDGATKLLVAIASLEFSELQEGFMELRGEKIYDKSNEIYKAIVKEVNKNIQQIKSGVETLVYASDNYNYFAGPGYNENGINNSAIYLTIKKVK